MFAFVKLLGLASVASALDLSSVLDFETGEKPGALDLYLNTTSINNMMQTFVPILSYYMLNNKTYKPDIHQSTILYSFDLDTILLNNATGFTTKEISNIPGTDKVHVKIGGVDVQMDLDGQFNALHFIPLKATHVFVHNASVEFTVESTSSDQLHWALVEKSTITFDKIDIKMSSSFLDKLVKLCRSIIDGMIKDQIPKLEKYINDQVLALNRMVAQEGKYTFVIPVQGNNTELNMTMTHAP